jgi:hypothetical protein
MPLAKIKKKLITKYLKKSFCYIDFQWKHHFQYSFLSVILFVLSLATLRLPQGLKSPLPLWGVLALFIP